MYFISFRQVTFLTLLTFSAEAINAKLFKPEMVFYFIDYIHHRFTHTVSLINIGFFARQKVIGCET